VNAWPALAIAAPDDNSVYDVPLVPSSHPPSTSVSSADTKCPSSASTDNMNWQLQLLLHSPQHIALAACNIVTVPDNKAVNPKKMD
jgi:hypothetical protein